MSTSCPSNSKVFMDKYGSYYLYESSKVYCQPRDIQIHSDWIKVVRKTSDKNFDYWIIPGNTILYHGTLDIEDDVLPETPTFYANLHIAAHYAFIRGGDANDGKVITVITTDDIKILNITPKTLTSLLQLKDAPVKYIRESFGTPNKIRRHSEAVPDYAIGEWLCDIGFEGFGYPQLSHFHNEVMLCNTDKLKRYSLEYRFSPDNPECMFEVNDSQVRQAIPFITLPGREIKFDPNTICTEEQDRSDYALPKIKKIGKKLCSSAINRLKQTDYELYNALKINDIMYLNKFLNNRGDMIQIETLLEVYGVPDTLNPETAKFLLDNYIRPNVLGKTSNIDIVELALKYGVWSDDSDILHYQLIHDNVDIIELLLQHGLTPNELFKTIFELGSDTRFKDRDHEEPDFTDFIDIALDAGADNFDEVIKMPIYFTGIEYLLQPNLSQEDLLTTKEKNKLRQLMRNDTTSYKSYWTTTEIANLLS